MAFAETYETRWTDPEWQAEARAWIEERLAAQGREMTGELESTPGQLERWASAVARYAELQRVAARRLGFVSGTLKWWETLQLVADPTRPPFDDAMPLRLRRLIELCD